MTGRKVPTTRRSGETANIGSPSTSACAASAGTRNWFLQRYELLWEAGLVAEGRHTAARLSDTLTEALGEQMRHDHRRILATGNRSASREDQISAQWFLN